MPNGIVAHAPDGVVRHRGAEARGGRASRHGRARPRAGRDHRPELRLGRDDLAARARATAAARRAAVPRRRHRLRHQAQHPAAARRPGLRGDGAAGDGDAPRTCCRASPTACSCRTAPATRRRPANMPCRRSRRWSRRACRPSASASATRCSASRSAARPTKMRQGHHGANHPVKDFTTGKVEIVSMNHGFALDRDEPARRTSRRRTSRSSTARTAASA